MSTEPYHVLYRLHEKEFKKAMFCLHGKTAPISSLLIHHFPSFKVFYCSFNTFCFCGNARLPFFSPCNMAEQREQIHPQ